MRVRICISLSNFPKCPHLFFAECTSVTWRHKRRFSILFTVDRCVDWTLTVIWVRKMGLRVIWVSNLIIIFFKLVISGSLDGRVRRFDLRTTACVDEIRFPSTVHTVKFAQFDPDQFFCCKEKILVSLSARLKFNPSHRS